jgi:hypothetical protein
VVTTKGIHRVSAEERPMPPYVGRLVDRLHDAEEELKGEVKDQQRRWHYRIRRGRVWFDKEFERRIGGFARAFRHTSLKAAS